jgi:1,2-diacylglycerol 3-beta-galactosyltransferase
VETTARALGEALYDANTGKPLGPLVVGCGRNKNSVRKLQQVNWKSPQF